VKIDQPQGHSMPRASRRDLRALSGPVNYGAVDAQAALDEIDTAPDRVAAIVSAALVEDALRWALNSFFLSNITDAEERELFENDGILSTFYAKIVMGYSLGLYGEVARGDLSKIKNIRNAFAHAPRPLDFTASGILSTCHKLAYIEAVAAKMDRKILRTAPLMEQSARSRFMSTVKLLILDLHVVGSKSRSRNLLSQVNRL
jgi:hypothetical protein